MGKSNRKNFLFFTRDGFTSDSNNKDIQNIMAIQTIGDVIRNLELGGKEWN